MSKFSCRTAERPTQDRDLERRVKNYLLGRRFRTLDNLEVQAHRGVVTMRGRVTSFYEKQLAIHSCQRVAGVHRLIDAVEVR